MYTVQCKSGERGMSHQLLGAAYITIMMTMMKMMTMMTMVTSTAECLLGNREGNGVLPAFTKIVSCSQAPDVENCHHPQNRNDHHWKTLIINTIHQQV